HPLAVAENGVGRLGQIDKEGLLSLVENVAVDLNGDDLRNCARVKSQDAVGSDVVSAGQGGAVPRGVTDRDRLAARARKTHGKYDVGAAGVSFGDLGGADGKGPQRVGVDTA